MPNAAETVEAPYTAAERLTFLPQPASDILAVLEPVAAETPSTAQRLRQGLEIVFDWAIANGHRVDNPAGKHILRALPINKEEVKHHDSLAYADVPFAFRKVAESTANESSKGALQFLILNANRVSEATGATWSEIDWDGKVWTVPAEGMKARKAHSIPLSTGALEVLRQAFERTNGKGLVFPGLKGKAISSRTIQLLLQRLEISCVPHGFRSSFRDWAVETGQDWTTAESALAHRLGTTVEAAYARTTLIEQRRALMEEWGNHVTG